MHTKKWIFETDCFVAFFVLFYFILFTIVTDLLLLVWPNMVILMFSCILRAYCVRLSCTTCGCMVGKFWKDSQERRNNIISSYCMTQKVEQLLYWRRWEGGWQAHGKRVICNCRWGEGIWHSLELRNMEEFELLDKKPSSFKPVFDKALTPFCKTFL